MALDIEGWEINHREEGRIKAASIEEDHAPKQEMQFLLLYKQFSPWEEHSLHSLVCYILK